MVENAGSQNARSMVAKALTLLGDAYFTWHSSTQRFAFSNSLYGKLGYTGHEFSSATPDVEAIIHTADLKKLKDLLNDLIGNRVEVAEQDFRLLDRDGNFKLFSARATLIDDTSDEEEPYVVGALFDIGHQVKTQEELLQSERRLKRAQEIARIGSWQEAPDPENIYWSNQTYRIFGFKKGAVKPTLRAIFPGLRKTEVEIFESMFNWNSASNELEKRNFEVCYKCSDGQERYLLFIAEPIISAKGNLLFWQGIVQDISIQRAFEKQLKEEKENLLALVANMPAIVLATDREGNLAYLNRTGEYLSGYKQRELVGNKDAFKLLFPEVEQRKKIRSYMKDLSISLSSWEQPLATKKGEALTIVWSAFSQHVKVEGWHSVAIGHDVTHRKENEQLQRNYRRKLEALAETAIKFVEMSGTDNVFHCLGMQLEKHAQKQVFVVFSFDENCQFYTIEGCYGIPAKRWEQILSVLGWNPVGRRLNSTTRLLNTLKRSKMTPAGQSLYELTEGVVSSVAARRIERLIAMDKIFVMGISKDERVLGGIALFTTHANPDCDFSLVEGLLHQAAMAQDRFLVEEQLLASKEKAEESDRLKSTFLANMSHEIRTPLNAILGFSQLLSMPNLLSQKKAEYASIVHDKGNNLVSLINDIVDASKVEAGELTLTHSVFKVNELLKQLKSFYDKEKVFKQRENIEIKLSLPKRSGNVKIYSDVGRIEQVLTNFMDNALKFTERGSIELGYTLDDTAIRFVVSDTGIGIDTEKQQLIFDRFRQLEVDEVRARGSNGLGLAISKGIVEMMGGTIGVESALGSGAEFFFTLPFSLVKEGLSDDKVEEEMGESPFPDWKNLVLLVAEDEEANFVFLKELLEPTGVKLLWAQDGAQAVDLVHNIKPIEAILMDIKMPVMNGYAATMEIKQINPNIPIIAQTAFSFTEDRQKAVAAGCNEYITKPIDATELFSKLEKYMKRRPAEG